MSRSTRFVKGRRATRRGRGDCIYTLHQKCGTSVIKNARSLKEHTNGVSPGHKSANCGMV